LLDRVERTVPADEAMYRGRGAGKNKEGADIKGYKWVGQV